VRIGYLDCSGGISGDMFVGALLSAGWPEENFRRTISWLSEEIDELIVERREHSSLAGLGLRVVSCHDHGGSAHAHGSHAHRGLADVLACLDKGDLAPPVREMAGKVFGRLAEAEAAAHGKDLAKIHFHEVGAVDAMIDVVSVCQGLFDLGVEKLYLSSIPVGQGSVNAAHGEIPLPAPATSYLLKGGRIRWMGSDERTTPTGAALATTIGQWGPPPPMTLMAVGTGAGSRSLPDVPNLARLFVGETDGKSGAPISSDLIYPSDPRGPGADPGDWRCVVELITQIDDATAESISLWSTELAELGALDVFQCAIAMKKNRVGTKLTVICRPDREEALTTYLLEATSTLGVRRNLQWRKELLRRDEAVQTPYGEVKVKLAQRADRWIGKPEFESCREVAQNKGVHFRDVYRSAIASLNQAKMGDD